ncbi:MAG: hypothetical protein ACRDQY_25915 [Pseudonocardiaceae bacterium]
MLLTTLIFSERRHIMPDATVNSLAATAAGRSAAVPQLTSDLTAE